MVAGAQDIRTARFEIARDAARVATVIRTHAPDAPAFLFRPHALQRMIDRFRSGFPGEISYAVKANPSPNILQGLVSGGMTAFDVASVAEMEAVRAVLPNARLHYHNPVRSPTEIDAAKRFGVSSWSIDRKTELDKLGQIPTDGEVAIRLSLSRKGGAYDFGSKFGASYDVARGLLSEVAARGMTPAITFHPGTQCTDPTAWTDYIAASAQLARDAGVTLATLNVGGGFPSCVGGDPKDLTRVFDAIRFARDTHFPDAAPAFWCEPGRAMVANAKWLLLRVKARSDGQVMLNDGVYGALGEWRDMPVPGTLRVLTPDGQFRSGACAPVTVFGPTCDSLDCLPTPWHLPCATAEGDYVLLDGAGAYTQALVTGFNGYGAKDVFDLSAIADEAGQHLLAS